MSAPTARPAALALGAPGRGSAAAAEAHGGGCLTCPRSLIDDQRERAIAALAAAYRRESELARRFDRIIEGETVSPAEVDRAIDQRHYAEALLGEWS